MSALAPMRPIVFLGPSCSRARAARCLRADYRPPALRGDIERAVAEGVRVIVLIDGFMIQSYPPSPMEVFTALEHGIDVYGASSLGALRAVELRHHGMRGIGWVYERYLDGTIWADDEVVTLLHPESNRAIGIPLVQVRFAVETLMRSGDVLPEQRAKLISLLRDKPYTHRTGALVRALATQCGLSPYAIDQLVSERFDVKQRDALECLSAVADCIGERPSD